MAELVDALYLGSVTTVEFSPAAGQAGKKRQKIKYAGMAELADAPDLGSGGEIHAGSIPVTRTKRRKLEPPDATVFLQKSSCRGVQICENKVKQKARFGQPRRAFCIVLLLCVADICGELRVLFPPLLCVSKNTLDQLFNLCG